MKRRLTRGLGLLLALAGGAAAGQDSGVFDGRNPDAWIIHPLTGETTEVDRGGWIEGFGQGLGDVPREAPREALVNTLPRSSVPMTAGQPTISLAGLGVAGANPAPVDARLFPPPGAYMRTIEVLIGVREDLLQAAGAQWAAGGRPWRLQPALLGSLPAVDTLGGGLLCVDDVPDLPPTAALELARAIDAAREGRWRLLLASATPVDALDLPFEDLRSRLQWGTRLNLKPLDEAALRRLLAQRARELGVRWTERSSEYLLRRLPREPGVLLHCLELAYRAAVSQRRQLAPPLLAQVLGSPEFAAAVEQAGAEP